MGARAAAKTIVICQPKKMSILLGRGEIPRLHCVSSRHPNGKETNQGRT